MSRRGNHKGNCDGFRKVLISMTRDQRHLFLLRYARAWNDYHDRTGVLRPHLKHKARQERSRKAAKLRRNAQ